MAAQYIYIYFFLLFPYMNVISDEIYACIFLSYKCQRIFFLLRRAADREVLRI